MTKTDEIRELLGRGFTISEIEFWTKAPRRNIYLVRWRDKRPGYHATTMAKYRSAKKPEQGC